MRYAYPCSIVRDEEEERTSGREAYTVTFSDVYGANTGGWSWEGAVEMAKDCLGVALGMYVKACEDIPAPGPPEEGQVLISVAPMVSAKLAVYTVMRAQGVTHIALADRLDLQENVVRRLLDPGHRSPMTLVEKALEAVGRSLGGGGQSGCPISRDPFDSVIHENSLELQWKSLESVSGSIC